MTARSTLAGFALAALLLASAAATAIGETQAPAAAPAAARYRNFELAIYCRVDDVKRMAEGDWLERNFDMLARSLKIGKVYLETHRSMVLNDRETMLKAKRFFEGRGVRAAGGITTVENEGFEFKTFCYNNPEHRQHLEKVVRFTASLFDELILDDFFFTTCKCDACIEAKGARSWSEYRLELMKQAAQSVVIGPAKQVNPKIKVVIKYPNWYEHFPYAGFNLEAQPRMFDGIYTGTETRDAQYTQQHLPEYQGYSIMRYFENVKPGGNGGGWVDPYARGTLDRYAEQIALTLLAKAREITLFCFSALVDPIRQPDGRALPASRVAAVAGDTLERADAILSQLGNPVGVASYKPYHSSGEDFLHSYLGMIGIPIELTPELRDGKDVLLLAESAKGDPAIARKLEAQLRAGRTVVVTSGLLKALEGKGIEQIVDLEVGDKKVLARRFSDFRNVFEGASPVLLPQVRYATNDSWEDLTALDGSNGYPLLHHADYSAGRLYVLTIPDNYSDLYQLPAPVLDRVRRVVTRGSPVRLQGQSRVSLFAYDNGTFVVQSFLPHHATVEVVAEGGGASLAELAGGGGFFPPPTGVTHRDFSRRETTTFTIDLEPHAYRAFRLQPAAADPAARR